MCFIIKSINSLINTLKPDCKDSKVEPKNDLKNEKHINEKPTENKIPEKVESNLSKTDDVIISESKNRFSSEQSLQEVLSGNKKIKKGDSGSDVKLIQGSLSDLGFYAGDKVDGKFGAQTEIAIKNFQDNRGIKKTGIIDKETMTELNKTALPVGKKLWDKGVLEEMYNSSDDKKLIPSNTVGDTKKRARVVVDLSEHRLFLYDKDNNIKKVYSVATGKGGWADGRGGKTHSGIKVVDSKNSDPSKVASQLWPETKGKAFGTKLLGLSFINPETGKRTNSGEELHGTFARNSIGTDASHGCMRMQNEDIEEVFKELRVGDLVKIQD